MSTDTVEEEGLWCYRGEEVGRRDLASLQMEIQANQVQEGFR